MCVYIYITYNKKFAHYFTILNQNSHRIWRPDGPGK